MDAAIDTAYALASLAYNAFGETDKASMYSSLAIAYGIYINGPDWPSYQAHATLEKEPENHWSYRSRLPKGPEDSKTIEKDDVKDGLKNEPAVTPTLPVASANS